MTRKEGACVFDRAHREPVLAAHLIDFSQAGIIGIDVAEQVDRSIVRIEWRAAAFTALFSQHFNQKLGAVGQINDLEELCLLRHAPVAAFINSDTIAAVEITRRFEPLCAAGRASMTDVSHGFVVLSCSGSRVRAVLDSMAPVDLDEREFKPAQLKRTAIAGHTVMIACLANDRFEIYVDRSLTLSFWNRLEKHARAGCI